jgi:5'-deoxynucleotidase YfbR-like HD superfamily hydrolase
MLSGRRLDLADPSPVDIEISDIAHGLARVARWNGQTVGENAFSVAQHSVLVLEIFEAAHPGASAAQRLMALLHDAPEYVVGDMISPFKAIMGGAYKELEERLLGAVHLRFGLPAQTPDVLRKRIKAADRACAFREATLLAGFSQAEALRFFGKPHEGAPLAEAFDPLPAAEAQSIFLTAFERLEHERDAAASGA